MILSFDTNVFLEKEANLWELLGYFPERKEKPRFLVALDEEGLIEGEYLGLAQRADEEEPIRALTKKLDDGKGWFVISTPVQVSQSLEAQLDAHNCISGIERQLLAIAQPFSHTLVCPNKHDHLRLRRRYLDPGILQSIQASIEDPNERPTVLTLLEVLRPIRVPHEGCPNDLEHLRKLLATTANNRKVSEERDFLEFKQPIEFLYQDLLRRAIRAVCGMLNSRDGWVIIGVDDATGEIKPFPPKYIPPNHDDAAKDPNREQLERDVRSEIDRISPKPGLLVDVQAILDERKEDCVVVIRVWRGNREYVYRDAIGKLNGQKWIRVNAETVADPEWQPCAQPGKLE
jgi:hypothetical protein